MNSRLNSRTSKTLVLSSGKTIAALGSIVLAMVLSRLFSKAEWATYRQTFLVFTMASPLLGMGLSQALFYFLPGQKQRNRGLLLENLIPAFVMGILYLLFIILGGNRWIADLFDNPMLATTLIVMAPIGIFQLVIGRVGPCLIASDRVLAAAVFSIISRIAVVVTVLAIVWFWPTVLSALWANTVLVGIASAAGLVLMLSVCKNGRPTLQGIRPQLAYGIPLGLSAMVGVLSRNVDRAMVSGSCSLDDYAVFDLGAFELPLIGIITGSMTSILLVDYRAMLQDGRKNEILPLLHRSTIKSGSILIPTMFFLLCVAPEFMVCMFGEKYRDSAVVFRIYLLLLPVRTLVFSAIGLAAGKTKSLAIVPVVTIVVNVVLNYFSIVYFGYVGCAIATVFVIYFIGALGRAIIAQQVLNCTLREFIPWKKFFHLVAGAAIPIPFVLLVNFLASANGELFRLTLSALVYIAILIPLFARLEFFDLKAFAAKAKQLLTGNV